MVRGDDRYSTFDALTGQDHTGLSPVYWTAGFTMGLQKRYIGEKETRLLKEQVLSDELGEAIAAILCLIGNHMDDRATPLPVTETVHLSLFRGVFPSSGFFHSATYLTVSSFQQSIQRLPLSATNFTILGTGVFTNP